MPSEIKPCSAGDFGEPWPKVAEGGMRMDSKVRITLRRYLRARDCVNACAGINPEAVPELVAVATGMASNWHSLRGDPEWTRFLNALAKIKGGE